MGNTVTSAITSCHKLVSNEMHTEVLMDESHQGYGGNTQVLEEAPKLGLRIFSNPCMESADGGALCARFLNIGGEVMATEIEKVKGWDALRSRVERSTKERAGVLYNRGPNATQTNAPAKLQWPEGYRFNTPRKFWRCKIISQDSQGGFQEHLCMIVVATAPEDRTQANVEVDLKDSQDVASYAARFNKQLTKLYGDNAGIPGVKVCAPVGCEVIKSSSSQFAQAGESIAIIPYPFAEVKKFLFDGSEDFLEVPQAFFHHAAWLSSSHEFICDLQGIEDDENNIILVDPCVIRAPKATVGNLLSTLTPGMSQKENVPHMAADIGSDRFDALHPRCSQLCKTFDPHRRSANAKRACGMNISCGV